MLCTSARGGMRSVVEGYRADGFFERQKIHWLVTHSEGSAVWRLLVAVRAWLAFVRLLLSGRVGLVHSHMAHRGSFWRKAAFNSTARRFGVPVVAHLHGSQFQEFWASLSPRLRRRLQLELQACVDVLVLSDSWASFVRGIAPGAKVTVVPNYVRVPAEAADTSGSGAGEVVGLFLGEIGRRKGVYDLLPALAEAIKLVPGLRLRVGGSGEVERARALAKELGLSHCVEFLGWIAGADKSAALATAQFYVLPSHNEGLPMSLLEAMSWGLPVISSTVGGIPELVRDGETGLLVRPGDVSGLAAALVRVGQDATWRASAGRAARARVQSFYSDVVVLPGLDAIYTKARRKPVRAE